MPAPTESAEQFWSRASAVRSLVDRDTVEAYEAALVEDCVNRAGGQGAVRRVDVVGVGAGRELAAIRAAAPNARIHAWDLAGPMVEACRERIAATGLDDVEVDRAAAADLADRVEGTDVVIALNALLCYPRPASERTASVDALARILRPGGAVGFVVQQRYARPDWALWFGARTVAARLGALRGDPGDRISALPDGAVLMHHYTRREVQVLVTGAGFTGSRVGSLREWARGAGVELPLRSTNPLIVSAVRPVEPAG